MSQTSTMASLARTVHFGESPLPDHAYHSGVSSQIDYQNMHAASGGGSGSNYTAQGSAVMSVSVATSSELQVDQKQTQPQRGPGESAVREPSQQQSPAQQSSDGSGTQQTPHVLLNTHTTEQPQTGPDTVQPTLEEYKLSPIGDQSQTDKQLIPDTSTPGGINSKRGDLTTESPDHVTTMSALDPSDYHQDVGMDNSVNLKIMHNVTKTSDQYGLVSSTPLMDTENGIFNKMTTESLTNIEDKVVEIDHVDNIKPGYLTNTTSTSHGLSSTSRLTLLRTLVTTATQPADRNVHSATSSAHTSHSHPTASLPSTTHRHTSTVGPSSTESVTSSTTVTTSVITTKPTDAINNEQAAKVDILTSTIKPTHKQTTTSVSSVTSTHSTRTVSSHRPTESQQKTTPLSQMSLHTPEAVGPLEEATIATDYSYTDSEENGEEEEEEEQPSDRRGSGGRRKNRNRQDKDRSDRPLNGEEMGESHSSKTVTSLTSTQKLPPPRAITENPLARLVPIEHPSYAIPNSPNNKSITITPLATGAPGPSTTLSDSGQPSSHTIAPASGLSSGAGIGLIVVGLCLFWLVMIPVICIACRLRRRMCAKGRGASKHKTALSRSSGGGGGSGTTDDMGAMLVEEMIRMELARGRDKLYRTNVDDLNEIQRLPVAYQSALGSGTDYENLLDNLKQASTKLSRRNNMLPYDSKILTSGQYANVSQDSPVSLRYPRTSGALESPLYSSPCEAPYALPYSPQSDEGRDTLTSMLPTATAGAPLSRDPSQQLTGSGCFMGYRSHDGSVSVDSGFDNRSSSMRHDTSTLSFPDPSPTLAPSEMIMLVEKPVYRGYAPVRTDSSLEKSLDGSPAISGYANIRQLRREHESAGSLTNDTTSVDSSSFHDDQPAGEQTNSGNKNGGYFNSEPRSAPKLPQVLDPSKYLICSNHVGSLEKATHGGGGGQQQRHLAGHSGADHSAAAAASGDGQCRCAFRASLLADDNCIVCRTPSSECLLDGPLGYSTDPEEGSEGREGQDKRVLDLLNGNPTTGSEGSNGSRSSLDNRGPNIIVASKNTVV